MVQQPNSCEMLAASISHELGCFEHWLGCFEITHEMFFLHWLGNFERILQQSVNCPINVECHNLFSKRAKLPKSFNFTQSMWNACSKHYTLIRHFSFLTTFIGEIWTNSDFTQSMWIACCKHYTLIGHFSKFLCLDHTSTSLLKTTQSMWNAFFTQSMWNACAIYVRKHFTLIG